MECRRGLAMRILSVRPSVRPSVKRVICDKMEEKSVQIFISYERSFSLFSEKKNGWWGNPFYKVSEMWIISCDNSETVRDRMSVTINRIRAYDWYQPRWPWMTLNAVLAPILCFFSLNSTDFQADYVTVVEDW